ncbi:hypothetical protein GGR88_001242 [Sphingomonas jejuensis]|uniref:ThuA-like domain-containing protein n=1 Tax=Sphingomonas jejuensis TaxID=904715 RepID=A0ABX0XKA2_9SPHN|nr:ThuA domain-containing protein [Sphingomonas jejuensis]NJC33768.1 hypothetical protein [Sphingomonas jejuensis]
MLRVAALALMALAQPAETRTPADPHLPEPVIDAEPPTLPEGARDLVLIVSKTNGWRHIEHIPHSNRVLSDIARALGRPAFVTENGAVFNDAQLGRVSLVVLNSASGNFLDVAQMAAFRRFVDAGGGVVALHAAGDGSQDDRWYRDTIVGTRFIGHPGGADHVQPALLVPAQADHPILAGVAPGWQPRDEWYSFDGSPAARGMQVLARIDEGSYRPGPDLAMGGDHPVIWINPNVAGRVVYSALGHTPEAYDDPTYRRILTNAMRWALEPQGG